MAKTNQAVAHEWANAPQHASGKSGNMFYRDAVIFSYGEHFPIARRVFDAHGAHVATLFTTARYSVTTSQHIGLARRANWAPTIDVPDVMARTKEDHVSNVQDMRERAEADVMQAAKRRSGALAESDIASARQLAADAHRYAELFGLRIARELAKFPNVDGAELADTLAAIKSRAEKQKKAQAAADRRAEKKRLAREAIERAEASEYLAEWRTDPTVRTVHMLYKLPVALRLSSDRAHVQTSHGATVETRHAVMLWRAMQSGRDIVGAHVGTFTVREVTAEYLQIGCHRIPRAEMAAVAATLGV